MNLALINIKQLVTVPSNGERAKRGAAMRDLGVIENAAVFIQDDLIEWVGRMEEMPMSILKETDVVDCIHSVVMPGFVDAHTHLVFAGSRENEFAMRSEGLTYEQIAEQGGGIVNTVESVRNTSKKDLKKQARHYLARLMRHGTTTVEIKSGYGLSMNDEIKLLEAIKELQSEEVIGIVSTFLGAHAFPPEYKGHEDGYIAEICNRMLPYIAERKLAEFCDVFCDKGYFSAPTAERILRQAKDLGLTPKIHAEELASSGGTKVAVALEAASADHLENISAEDIRAIAQSDVVGVLLPGVSFFLNHGYAPARALIDAGAAVAIASDFNPGSCMSYSMPTMMTIACTQMRMTPEEAITASTLNAAAAINRSHEVGSIEVNKKADIVILNIPNYRFLPYHFGENHVDKVIKNGVVLEF
jgi:imidazolonepropionase